MATTQFVTITATGTATATASITSTTTATSFAYPTPGFVAFQTYESDINIGMFSMALLLILIASAVGFDAAIRIDSKKKLTDWRIVYGLFVINLLLDLYCYFSLIEFLANGTWNRRYGYSPFPFLVASCFAITRPRNFEAFFEFIDRINLAKRIEKVEGWLIVWNILFVIIIVAFTIYRMSVNSSVQFNGVRTLVQLNGKYNYVDGVDQLSVSPNWLYSEITCNTKDCSYLWTANLHTCTSNPNLIDPTIANSSSLVCLLRHPQLNTYFNIWGIFILLALFYVLFGGTTPEAWGFPAVILVFLVVVEWFVVLGRDAHSPGIDASLLWCPTAYFQECQYLDFGTVYPYSVSQSATWFWTLGPFPVDKIAGYGMVPDAWR
ncbi:hypothetical protein HK405_003156 [Cladochytrium tenue]|nr:hypothetical protein HK405_003156 [Cladochytrium tenue]